MSNSPMVFRDCVPLEQGVYWAIMNPEYRKYGDKPYIGMVSFQLLSGPYADDELYGGYQNLSEFSSKRGGHSFLIIGRDNRHHIHYGSGMHDLTLGPLWGDRFSPGSSQILVESETVEDSDV